MHDQRSCPSAVVLFMGATVRVEKVVDGSSPPGVRATWELVINSTNCISKLCVDFKDATAGDIRDPNTRVIATRCLEGSIPRSEAVTQKGFQCHSMIGALLRIEGSGTGSNFRSTGRPVYTGGNKPCS